jgi:hypothetical protein
MQTKEYTFPNSGLRSYTGPKTVTAYESHCPGLLITPQLYNVGDSRPKHEEFAITHARSGLAICMFIPNLDTARKLTAVFSALPLGWEMSKASVNKQFRAMDYVLRLWLFSVMSMEGDTVN